MILREIFAIDKDSQAIAGDLRYSDSHDSSVMNRKDTRKTRLTLKQINQLRKASETHVLEQESDLEYISQMYNQPAAQ
jgi:hypothetical protein